LKKEEGEKVVREEWGECETLLKLKTERRANLV
jgi:hypothetical protein